MRYQEGLSLREIAEHKHLSSERIRQILAKVMRKLRHPKYRWQLCLGAECVLAETKSLRENPDETNLYEALAEKRRKTTLEELGLSVRPYNALYRYFACNHLEKNAESVASLHGHLDLVRGIGRNSEKEIVAVMKQFGINMAE